MHFSHAHRLTGVSLPHPRSQTSQAGLRALDHLPALPSPADVDMYDLKALHLPSLQRIGIAL